jgi:Putative zinc-finger
MANSGMIEHVSTEKMERFCARILPESELIAVAAHLVGCEECHGQFINTLGRQRDGSPVSFILSPEFWLRHEHIDYEQLVDLADNKLDTADRELIELHLKNCAPCEEDVRSFLAFREQIEPEMEVSYGPIRRQPASKPLPSRPINWWRGLAWKRAYATAVILIGIAIIIGAALLLNRRTANEQVQHLPTPSIIPDSNSDNRAVNGSPSRVEANESPTLNPNSAEATVVLSDRAGTIRVDKSGNVTGLDDVPAATRDQIAKVLLSERLERPTILKELGGQEGGLRGGRNTAPFKLIAPSRTVIVTDRPTLKWEKAAGATSYRVYLNDRAGQVITKSDELPSETTEWKVTQGLKRGEVYVWTAVAIIDGKEIVSPGPAAPEMKFQVLSIRSLEQLNTLKKTRSHLALGVFCANAGLTAEAQQEFQELVRLNPKSKVAGKLLKAVSSTDFYQ